MTSHVATFPDAEPVAMSPPREAPAAPVNAERLSFTMQMVIALVVGVSTILGSVYAATAELRKTQADMQSDIRDIRTRMESQAEVRKLEKELLDAQLAAMKSAIDNSTNRAAALNMAQELSKLQNERRAKEP